MRKPQGYATIVGDLPNGAPTIVERGIQHKETEIDTVTCHHCCRVFHVGPKAHAEDIGGLCKQCMELICSKCVDKGVCIPWEKEIKIRKAREESLRSYGM